MTPSPKLVRQTWANVYREDEHGPFPTREWADNWKRSDRISVLRRDFHDDGTCKAVLEDV